MKNTRGFLGALLVVGAAIGLLIGFDGVADSKVPEIGTIEMLLGILIAAVAFGAMYVGAALDAHRQPIQPPQQGHPQQ